MSKSDAEFFDMFDAELDAAIASQEQEWLESQPSEDHVVKDEPVVKNEPMEVVQPEPAPEPAATRKRRRSKRWGPVRKFDFCGMCTLCVAMYLTTQ